MVIGWLQTVSKEFPSIEMHLLIFFCFRVGEFQFKLVESSDILLYGRHDVGKAEITIFDVKLRWPERVGGFEIIIDFYNNGDYAFTIIRWAVWKSHSK